MSHEKYLVCHKCKSYVYACKNGRITGDNSLAEFIEYHEHQCDGSISVWDESIIPPYSPGGGLWDCNYDYKEW